MAKGGELIRFSKTVVFSALVLGLAPLFLLLMQQGSDLQFDKGTIGILLFTLKQAALSTLLSVLPAIFIARALAHTDFIARKALLMLFALPMAVPAIVAVLGLTALIGNGGIFPNLISPYSLTGILMVHVFFNLPMATRLIYQSLQAAPLEAYRLAAQLGLGALATFREVEWPQIKAILPSLSAIIFLLCAASFVVVLTLGGASSTTLEVAIFQSLRMDFDPPRALALSLLQIAVCGAFVILAQGAFRGEISFVSLKNRSQFYEATSASETWGNKLVIAIATFVVSPPIAVILWRGLGNIHYSLAVLQAVLTSLAIGFSSALVTIVLAWPLARVRDGISQFLSLSGLIVPPAVLATGWFLVLHKLGDSTLLTGFLIVSLNSLMALPFATSALCGGMGRLQPLSKLQEQLGVGGLDAFRLIELPLLWPFVAQAFLIAMVLSLGDLTAITLLGNGGIVTLPALLRTEMGHYRTQDADGTALLLLCICAALTWAARRWVKADA